MSPADEALAELERRPAEDCAPESARRARRSAGGGRPRPRRQRAPLAEGGRKTNQRRRAEGRKGRKADESAWRMRTRGACYALGVLASEQLALWLLRF